MRLYALLLTTALSGCAVFGTGPTGPGNPSADMLWRQGHHAMRMDSVRVALAAFQRLAAEHPNTGEGREARFHLGTLYLDPANTAFNPERAAENLETYVIADTAGGAVARRPEAQRLLVLARQLSVPCEQRTGTLRCDPTTVVRTRAVAGDTVVVRTGGDQSGEVARLRREVAERDATIRDLREELTRIRNTLAPRPD